ncbi:MAG: VOC family protein [Alphaproteobacteria bacterium]
MAAARSQLPDASEVFLDHVAWFAPDMAAAEHCFTRLGFTLTPFTPQSNAGPHGPIAAGTGNRCAMLGAGYLEILTSVPGPETELSRQLIAALGRYTGIHLVAFATADTGAEGRRLQRQGFDPLPAVDLRRPVKGAEQDAEAAFTVLRLAPGAMAEGRIQFLTHHTPDLVWQRRFMAAKNAVTGLTGVLFAVDDMAGAARRYGCFTGRAPDIAGDTGVITLDRGCLIFAGPERCRSLVPGIEIPAMPFIAAVLLESRNISLTQEFLEGRGVDVHGLGAGAMLVPATEAMGASLVIHHPGWLWPGLGP